MWGAIKRPIFNPSSKPEISLAMERIGEWEDHGYGLTHSWFSYGEIEGGHEVRVSGIADEYWRGGEEVTGKKLRMHVKIESDLSRITQMDRGILGGGQFYENYVDIELNLEPGQVRDVLYELRHSTVRRLSIAGNAISREIFRVTRFGLSGPRED